MSGPLAVYVHIPFCTVKCGYCDFNAYAGLDHLKTSYMEALLREVEAWSEVLGSREVATISFGGGTPSEVPPSALARVIEAVAALSGLASSAEVSIEVNPGTLGRSAMADLRASGVNRVSFGVQSFDAAELAGLDRTHSPEAAVAAIGLAREAGFDNVGIDLIYGLPAQTIEGWRRNLGRAVELQVDHISCYALTIEEGTPFARRVREGDLPEPDPDAGAACYELAESVLASAGYRHYELSNWAFPGQESRHNLTYWTDAEYLGIGAGAHGYLGGERYENVAHPRAYIERMCQAGGSSLATPAAVEPITAMFDWLETHLRLVDGFEIASFERRFGRPHGEVLGAEVERLEGLGMLVRSGGRLGLTAAGRLLHSEVCVELLLALRRGRPAPR